MHDPHSTDVRSPGLDVLGNREWLFGLPVLGAALLSGLTFGWPACVAGVLMASFASFVLYIPMVTLWLNGGQPLAADAAAPVITPVLQRGLLALWAVTAWVVAWIAAA